MNNMVKVGQRFYLRSEPIEWRTYYLSVGKFSKKRKTYHLLMWHSEDEIYIQSENLDILRISQWVIE